MKKLVLVVAMFMFVCGGSFFAMAQKPATTVQPEVVAVNDTVVPDTTKKETVSCMLPSADLVMVNDTVVPDTAKAE